MRRWTTEWALVFLAGAALLAVGQAPKPRPEPPQATSGASQKGKPRFIVPGLGGAVPPRKRPQTATPAGHMPIPVPPFGPPNPNMPGQGPASVAVPGQNASLPGLSPFRPSGLPMLEARPISRFLFGVNVVWGDNGGSANWFRDNGATARQMAQLMKDAGVTNTRIGISWGDVERVRGRYDWSETDRLVRFVAEQGFAPVCVVAGTPDWALDNTPETRRLFRDRGVGNLAGARPPEPPFYADLGRFAYACAQRYGRQIKHWEFWNEPDGMGMPRVVKNAVGRPVDIRYGGDPKVYTELLKVFSRSVKRADPTARVAVGGLQVLQTDFLAGIYAGGGRPFFDAIALHPYRGGGPLAFDWIDRCRDLVVRQGDATKTFWLTEWGWATSPGQRDGISELHQARLVRESLAAMRLRPFITQASYHTLNDWRTNESDPKSLVATGLCTRDLAPKPAYFAFREVAVGVQSAVADNYRRVNLVGGLPPTEEGGVRGVMATVRVDAARPGPSMPPLWEGFAQGHEPGGLDLFEGAVPRLKALNARLVRFDPFPNPDSVMSEMQGAERPKGVEPILLDSPTGSTQSVTGHFVDWRYADAMIEAVSRAGAKPMMHFATMPTALSAPENARLPRDPRQWSAFVEAVVRRYNVGQKRGILYWEFSNRPNVGRFTVEEWLRVYEPFARAVLAADPNARVGGPALAGFDAEWLKALADHCAQSGVPLHFLTWHAYGQPPAECARQVVAMRDYLRRHPSLKDVELIIGEWNARPNRSPEHDGLVAAMHALSMAEQLIGVAPVKALFYQVKEGQDFRKRDARFTGRWGLLTHDNRPKAVYNAFQMLSRLAGARLPASSEETSIHALASRSGDSVRILVWHAPQAPSSERRPPDAPIRLQVKGLPWQGGTQGQQWLMDARHANAYENPAKAELEQVAAFRAPEGDLEMPLVLAPHAATLLELKPARPAPLEVMAETPRFVVYGGSAFPIAAHVRNNSAQPQTVAAVLTSSDAGLLPAAGARARPETIPPGATRTFRFTLRAPLSRPDGQAFFQVTALPAGPGAERTGLRPASQLSSARTPEHLSTETAGLAVKFVTPIRARLETMRDDAQSADSTAKFQVALENRADAPIRVTLTSGKATTAATVPARIAASVEVRVPAPSAEPGNYTVPLRVLLGDRTVATLNAVVSVPALCKRAAQRPRINGDLSEWTNAFPILLERAAQSTERAWGGPQDLAAQALTMWDDENFYLAASVTDDTHFQPLPPENLGRADSVQFALDTRRDAPPDRAGYDANDAEFGLSSGPTGGRVYRFVGAGGKPPGLVAKVEVVVRRVGSRTIYEAAIPWSELAAPRPRSGALMGFSLLLNDSDGQGRSALEWAGGIGDAKLPGRFIGLRLVK